jgi:hypothetical protein
MSPDRHAHMAHVVIVILAALVAFAWQVGIFS